MPLFKLGPYLCVRMCVCNLRIDLILVLEVCVRKGTLEIFDVALMCPGRLKYLATGEYEDFWLSNF